MVTIFIDGTVIFIFGFCLFRALHTVWKLALLEVEL